MGSRRFPGKVLKKINGKTLIEILFYRLSLSKMINKIILATSASSENDILAGHIEKKGFSVFRGDENNVLSRYYEAAKIYEPTTVIRITGDCPIIDPKLVDRVISFYKENKLDYATIGNPPTFPDGLDTEVFSFKSLQIAQAEVINDYDKEHVTPNIRNSKKFKTGNFLNKTDYSSERWTVDEPEDFEVIKNIIMHFSPNLDFSWQDVLELKKSHPSYFSVNNKIIRNEGVMMGSGQKLWKRAKKIIPGGNMLLSKRAEMFLPDQWPAYFSKAKGCNVWDLDGNKYIDMSIMGIGTNILGYSHPDVDYAVKQVVDKGNMSTLNCPEEVYLAERLIELHPWSDMVRFARTGGEANTIAIRIARAATGKDKIAFCGYHGWHDWYLSSNLNESNNLDSHLLPGLEPNGVPKILRDTAFPFGYNNIDQLKKIISENNDIGTIIMEVSRSKEPANNFLKNVRKIAIQNNIVLIFDECTSGFRESFGGLHKKYNIEPDMAMFGKALGNGYAINAVLGRQDIMEAAQTSFISSTFWTERIGPAAGLKTLEIMEVEETWNTITKIGMYITDCWQEIASENKLPMTIGGLSALCNFSLRLDNWLKYKTYITQEMLKRGYFASNSVYVCIDHTKGLVDQYIDNLNDIFSIIVECEQGKDINSLLEGPVCHTGFKRLN
jgi:glutamate-1-semialdehyde aminotransferase/spore coat polysaccharide biosynthesis protein SpsF (cytidylyltransferase family)